MDRACAGSMIGNYRQLFKERTGRKTSLTDDQIFDAIESVGTASSGEEQEDWTIEAMSAWELKKPR